VLHADPEAAEKALAKVRAEWSPAPPGADHEGIFDDLVGRAPQPEVKAVKGDVEAALGPASRRFESTFRKGYVAHAPMEPHVSTAVLENGKLTVWASTQTPFPTQGRLAQVLSLDPKSVRVLTPYVGGGFGGKSAGRQSEEAARIAKLTGRPVQVAFTRAEEFFYDTFDPACVVKIVSSLDGDGKIASWDYDVYFAGDRGAELFYDVPHTRMRVFGGWRGAGSDAHRFAVGPWRAPGANMNVFARESHIDVMAAAAGLDPVEFRLRNMGDERMRRVLREAAKAFAGSRHPGRADGAGALRVGSTPAPTPCWPSRWPWTGRAGRSASSASSARRTWASSSTRMGRRCRSRAASRWASATSSRRRCASAGRAAGRQLRHL